MEKNKSIIRELVYKEKSRYEDFGVNNKGTVDQMLYDEYLLTRVDLMPGKRHYSQKIAKTLNDAHFVCTLILYSPYLKDELDYFVSNVSLPSVVMPMVHFYLSKLTKRTVKIGRYMTMIETEAKGDPKWKQNLDDIKVLEDKYQFSIEPSFFPRREIDSVLLSTINWYEGTNHYDKKWIKNLLIYIPKNKDECCMIAKAIKDIIMEYDYSIRPDRFYDDGEDRLDVIYPPYSTQSEEICELCNETTENYEEILSKKQVSSDSTEEANKLENKKVILKQRGKYSEIFDEKLNVSAIADKIKIITKYNASSRIFF